jgi:hypothetical protein
MNDLHGGEIRNVLASYVRDLVVIRSGLGS